jgi:hypothetical protein
MPPRTTTIISIMFFNTFTALTTKTMQAFEDCDRHIAGVVAVIKLRRSRQIRDPSWTAIFLCICALSLSRAAFITELQVPADLIKLREEAEDI